MYLNIVMCYEHSNHTYTWARTRPMWDGSGGHRVLVCQQPHVTNYVLLHHGWTLGITKDGQGCHHLPPTPQPGAPSYPKVPVHPSTMPMYKETTHIPQDSDPTDWQARIWATPKERRAVTSTLALLLLIPTIWMIKHEVEHVKIITHKLYANSYIMIITRQLYSSSYALLYKWYESMTTEELFIVLFIPRCHSSSKEPSPLW